eukprot:TRINITY_DN5706_c0_g1_i9.p1 TRINITY_DN5706_c0_g1~~TRINITY_DN5706_c0_g1_i9.p1  ORF type:complete len:414 (+),score=69.94 TRINITY_DN5706_c0_g1_i9:212-1453(+)
MRLVDKVLTGRSWMMHIQKDKRRINVPPLRLVDKVLSRRSWMMHLQKDKSRLNVPPLRLVDEAMRLVDKVLTGRSWMMHIEKHKRRINVPPLRLVDKVLTRRSWMMHLQKPKRRINVPHALGGQSVDGEKPLRLVDKVLTRRSWMMHLQKVDDAHRETQTQNQCAAAAVGGQSVDEEKRDDAPSETQKQNQCASAGVSGKRSKKRSVRFSDADFVQFSDAEFVFSAQPSSQASAASTCDEAATNDAADGSYLGGNVESQASGESTGIMLRSVSERATSPKSHSMAFKSDRSCRGEAGDDGGTSPKEYALFRRNEPLSTNQSPCRQSAFTRTRERFETGSSAVSSVFDAWGGRDDKHAQVTTTYTQLLRELDNDLDRNDERAPVVERGRSLDEYMDNGEVFDLGHEGRPDRDHP